MESEAISRFYSLVDYKGGNGRTFSPCRCELGIGDIRLMDIIIIVIATAQSPDGGHSMSTVSCERLPHLSIGETPTEYDAPSRH